MNACDRVRELAPQIERTPGPEAQVLWREYVNVWLECNGHPEDATRNSADIRELAATIVGRLNHLFITIEDTDLQLGAIIAGKENSCTDPTKSAVHRGADPVMSFNGQFVYETSDLSISGAGIRFVFTRAYKNRVRFAGPLGASWNHSYNHSLRIAQQTIFRSTGDLAVEAFIRHPRFGQSGFNYWMPPDGRDGVIVEHGNSFAWWAPHGVSHFFEQDSNPFLHRLRRVEDRHGNYLQMSYVENRLARVAINNPNRIVTFSYDVQNRLTTMEDFTGRQWSYCYGDFGDLVSVTGPATDDYPNGLKVCYEYNSAKVSGELQHNLCRIVDPAGRVVLENEYGTDRGLLQYNRVVRQRQGGGEYSFEYEDVPPEGGTEYSGEERPAHQTVRVERNGQPVCQVFNRFGQLLSETQRVLDDGVLRTLTWRYRFNRDGALIGTLSPEGVLTQKLFGREYFARRHGVDSHGDVLKDALTLAERQGFGRLLATVKRARPYGLSELNLARGVWGDFYPDIIAGFDPEDAVAKFTYEPTYGHLLTSSDPRFTRSPDPAMQTAADGEDPRYQDTLTRFVYRGPAANPSADVNRLLSEVRHPTPTGADGTPGSPVIDHFIDYDDRGRLLRAVDAAGMETVHTYHGPSDGIREGYLQQTVIDPAGLALTTRVDVDELGRPVAVHSPRSVGAPPGQFVTRTAFNKLDQIVSVTGPEPFAFTTRRFYDRSGKLTREERDTRGEAGDDLPGGPDVRAFEYDAEFNLVRETSGGSDTSTHLEKRHRYNRAGQRILTMMPEGNTIRFRYDERQLLVSEIKGADTDTLAATGIRYDGDSRVRAVIDARGHKSTFSCDPYGRVVATEDRLGNITRRSYDKLDQARVKRVFEKRHDGYYLLARHEAHYDELGREVRSTVNRFPTPLGPLAKHELPTAYLATPGPGDVLTGMTFYDARDRPVRTVDAMLRERRYEYDAAGRLRTIIDPLGSRLINHFDAHGNVIRRDQIDLVRDPDDPALVTGQRVFSASASFDALDRISTSSDSLGNTTRMAYDSRGLLVRRVDALGNTARIGYDIHRRRVYQCNELTATGLGGSSVVRLVEERFDYDRNGNLVRTTDGLGRAMAYIYDALDRRRVFIYPDGSRRLLDFDADGHLVHSRDNNGIQQRYTIDPLGRIVRVETDTSLVTSGATGGATFEHFEYDARNRRVREVNDFATCTVQFDSLDLPVSETITCTAPGAHLQTPLLIERVFNNVGNLISVRYPGGRELQFDRDELNRVIRLRNTANGDHYPGDPATPDASEIARFDFAGQQRWRRRNGNGTTTMYRHDGSARLIEVDHANAGGLLLTLQYLFDGTRNVRTRHDMTNAGNGSEVFSYDSMRRLVSRRPTSLPAFNAALLAPPAVPLPDPLPRAQDAIDTLIGSLSLPPAPYTFDYDDVGNRQVKRDGAEVLYTTNALDQYTQIVDTGTGDSTTFGYDLNGNLRDDEVRTYVYDAVNRLVRVSEGNVTLGEFFHDTRGRRVMERTPGRTVQIVWDGMRPIAEYHNGTLSAQFVHADGNDHLVQIASSAGAPGSPGAEHWYHTDIVGSVRMLTTRAGLPATSYSYEPFGKTHNPVPNIPYNPFLYAGMRFDRALDTYDCHFREYDPRLGRFLQRDPAASSAGSNLYIYAGNAPLGLRDPLGTEARPEVERAAKIEASFKPYWEKLAQVKEKKLYSMTAAAPKEHVPGNRAKVDKVFGTYAAILKEVQDSVQAGRPVDIKELWNKEHRDKAWDFEDTSWMYLCSRCHENPSLMDVGPFGEDVAGIDIARVFRIVTGDEQPNPSLAVRAVRFVAEAALVFGPDIAIGIEMGFMRRGALGGGAARTVSEIRPISREDFLTTRPGDSIAMGTYGGRGHEEALTLESMKLGYRTLGTQDFDAARLGIDPPVPHSVRAHGDDALVNHEVNAYLKPADRIGFWLTGEEWKYPNSITSKELQRIMDDPALYNKTRFYINPFAQEEVAFLPNMPGVIDVIPK